MNRLTSVSIVPPPELTRRSFLPSRFVFIAILAAWLAILPTARAVDPPPDGGYPNEDTAEGDNALSANPDGGDNTAVGFQALFMGTPTNSTAVGAHALEIIRGHGGFANTAIGAFAHQDNEFGIFNTACGFGALRNSSGYFNTAVGASALGNGGGIKNTGIGLNALLNNRGQNNTATGAYALQANGGGYSNTGDGCQALANNGGSNNTATGAFALRGNSGNGSGNTADGYRALTNNSGSENIALGDSAGIRLTNGNSNIDIGNLGIAGESNTIRIGFRRNAERYVHCRHQWSNRGKRRSSDGRYQWPARHSHFVSTLQGCHQADGQSERSNPRTQASNVPLQAGT